MKNYTSYVLNLLRLISSLLVLAKVVLILVMIMIGVVCFENENVMELGIIGNGF